MRKAIQDKDLGKVKRWLLWGANPSYPMETYYGETPLMLAVNRNPQDFRRKAVQLLLDKGADVEVVMEHYYNGTILHHAMEVDDLVVFKMLAEAARPQAFTIRNSYGKTPLGRAFEYRRWSVVHYLLDKCGLQETVGQSDSPILSVAVQSGAPIDVLEKLVALGADVNAADKDGLTPLHFAVLWTQPEATTFLLRAGALVNAAAQDGSMPLHKIIARDGGEGREIMPALLEAPGIFLDAKDRNGKTPLDIAAAEGNKLLKAQLLLEAAQKSNVKLDVDGALLKAMENPPSLKIMRLLVQAGAGIETTDAEGRTLLVHAVMRGSSDDVLFFLGKGAKATVSDKKDWTLLHHAAARKDDQETPAIIETLLAVPDIDFLARDDGGQTPLIAAINKGKAGMVQKILEAAKARDVELDLGAALHVAAVRDNTEIVKTLLTAGASIEAVDAQGRTPVMNAARSGNLPMIQFFFDRGARLDLFDKEGSSIHDLASKDDVKKFLRECVGKTPMAGSRAATPQTGYARTSDHSLEVYEGESLTATFNFLTQEVVYQGRGGTWSKNFAEIQRQEAIEEMRRKLIDLGGHPPAAAPEKPRVQHAGI